MSRKKHRNNTTKQNKNIDQRPKSGLFSEIDAKSVGVSGYILGHGAPQNNQIIQENSIPTGVVDIDESVVFPASSFNSHQQSNSKPYTVTQSNQKSAKEHVHLPPIIHHSKQHHKHYPYEYFYTPPNSYQSKNLYHYYPIYPKQQSSYHYHHPRHIHERTYDPRWWYMPINSVHGPRSRLLIDDYYVPPKWYELPRR